LLYPSWIEIPVADMARAEAFYRAVFGFTDTPHYDDPPALITVLLGSEKSVRQPGVSLVHSPLHRPSPDGLIVNFHLGDHAALDAALEAVRGNGGEAPGPVNETDDGVKYVIVRDSEGNSIALSSYEPPAGDEGA
jgi:predicted enzyme related to lactoylglutathione lyase